MLTFYTAGKTWHAPKFQMLRDTVGMPVKARWIDLDNDGDLVQNRKDELWKQCFEDVRDSDFLLLYNGLYDEELRGALVEIGMAYGMGKRVYTIGKSKSISATKTSDVAFTHYENWTWLDTGNLVEGALQAMSIEANIRKQTVNLKLAV